jgi:hypothetical protein
MNPSQVSLFRSFTDIYESWPLTQADRTEEVLITADARALTGQLRTSEIGCTKIVCG